MFKAYGSTRVGLTRALEVCCLLQAMVNPKSVFLFLVRIGLLAAGGGVRHV